MTEPNRAALDFLLTRRSRPAPSLVAPWPAKPEIETILNTEHDAIMTESETVDEGIANMNEQVQAILG